MPTNESQYPIVALSAQVMSQTGGSESMQPIDPVQALDYVHTALFGSPYIQ
jgi:microcystin-dependent protein